MTSDLVRVLYEDNHLLCVDKPALLPTMGAGDGVDSLWLRAKAYVKAKYQKPGNVFLGVVSRLDKPVTGVVVFARTSKAAARLSEAFRLHRVMKHYLAMVPAGWEPAAGQLVDWLKRDESTERMVVCGNLAEGAQKATLVYQRLYAAANETCLAIRLLSGRKHQIRVQLGARRFPIFGDRTYGSRVGFPRGIALHSTELTIPHPTQDRQIHVVSPLPPCWGERKKRIEAIPSRFNFTE